jgi:hypothetical protein
MSKARTNGRGSKIDPLYTYNYLCMYDRSEMNIELSREIDFEPRCLKCNGDMVIRYSIDNYGEIWMNSSIMHE